MRLAARLRRLFQKDDRLPWREHWAMVRAFDDWNARLGRGHPVLDHSEGTTTAYVASFRRPQNIEPIARSLLACPSIGRVIVSNNNPAVRLDRWLALRSPRLTVLTHAEPQSCLMRYDHLRRLPGERFLMTDDDIFLLPPQIERLCAKLEEDPSVPHGIFGQRWLGDRFESGIQRREERVDVLNRVYAFTAAHVAEVFRLAALLGMHEDDERWKRFQSDDLLLSFAGSARPRVHDAGAHVDCPSQGRKGTAVWREEAFQQARPDLYRSLLALKPLSA